MPSSQRQISTKDGMIDDLFLDQNENSQSSIDSNVDKSADILEEAMKELVKSKEKFHRGLHESLQGRGIDYRNSPFYAENVGQMGKNSSAVYQNSSVLQMSGIENDLNLSTDSFLTDVSSHDELPAAVNTQHHTFDTTGKGDHVNIDDDDEEPSILGGLGYATRIPSLVLRPSPNSTPNSSITNHSNNSIVKEGRPLDETTRFQMNELKINSKSNDIGVSAVKNVSSVTASKNASPVFDSSTHLHSASLPSWYKGVLSNNGSLGASVRTGPSALFPHTFPSSGPPVGLHLLQDPTLFVSAERIRMESPEATIARLRRRLQTVDDTYERTRATINFNYPSAAPPVPAPISIRNNPLSHQFFPSSSSMSVQNISSAGPAVKSISPKYNDAASNTEDIHVDALVNRSKTAPIVHSDVATAEERGSKVVDNVFIVNQAVPESRNHDVTYSQRSAYEALQAADLAMNITEKLSDAKYARKNSIMEDISKHNMEELVSSLNSSSLSNSLRAKASSQDRNPTESSAEHKIPIIDDSVVEVIGDRTLNSDDVVSSVTPEVSEPQISSVNLNAVSPVDSSASEMPPPSGRNITSIPLVESSESHSPDMPSSVSNVSTTTLSSSSEKKEACTLSSSHSQIRATAPIVKTKKLLSSLRAAREMSYAFPDETDWSTL